MSKQSIQRYEGFQIYINEITGMHEAWHAGYMVCQDRDLYSIQQQIHTHFTRTPYQPSMRAVKLKKERRWN